MESQSQSSGGEELVCATEALTLSQSTDGEGEGVPQNESRNPAEIQSSSVGIVKEEGPDPIQTTVVENPTQEVLDGQEIVVCGLSDLKFEKKLAAYPPSTKFRIVGYYTTKYNSFNLMPNDYQQEKAFRLSEEILDIAENPEASLGKEPKVRQVVLAPRDKQYFRSLVLEVGGQGQVEVYLFDVGGYVTVDQSVLKPINKTIQKFPILSYHVVLKDLAYRSNLFFIWQFEALMRKLSDKEFQVEPGTDSRDEGDSRIRALMTRKRVDIFYMDGLQKVSLYDEIMKLKVWEWQRFSNCTGDDNEVCANGAFGTSSRSSHSEIQIKYYDLKIGAGFSAQISSVKPRDPGAPNPASQNAAVSLVLLDDPVFMNYFNVLHSQMQRYVRLIKPSNFFPAYHEPSLFKLKANDRYKGLVKMSDQWSRGIRYGDTMYLVDIDDFIPFMQLPKQDYEIRRLYGEFMHVPILTVTVYPCVDGRALTLKEAKETFAVGKRYAFKITDDPEDSFCEASFNPTPVSYGLKEPKNY